MIHDELLHKWVNGELSKEEEKEFRQRPEYPQLLALHQHTDDLEAPEFDSDAMLTRILSQKKEKNEGPVVSRRLFLNQWVKYGVAASIAFLLLWFLYPTSTDIVVQTAYGETHHASLPDGSSVVLNADSRLSYNPEKWSNERSLVLNGEAFFDIEKGKKFTINTPNGAIQILGTSFNVQSRKQSLTVKCKTGRVAVLSLDNKQTELTAGKAVQIKGTTITTLDFDASTADDWVKGIFRFKNIPLGEVLAEAERQFSIKFISEGVNLQELITTNFKNKDLELSLKATLLPLGIDYRIEGKKVYLVTTK